MRIWSLHPKYLDRQGLVACWRETLLAQAVLSGATRGYRKHPQLQRFRALDDPLDGVIRYLEVLAAEAHLRGYRFDRARIRVGTGGPLDLIAVTDGQLAFEWSHLLAKLAARSPDVHERWKSMSAPDVHPLFRQVQGPIADWERP